MTSQYNLLNFLPNFSFSLPVSCLVASQDGGAEVLGEMPEWDLSDLYAGPTCDRLSADIQLSEKLNFPYDLKCTKLERALAV